MASVDEVERLADRYGEIQKELIGLLNAMKQMREVLSRAPEELIDIRKVLTSIGSSTEKAAHSLLEMMEEIIEGDENDKGLDVLRELELSEEGKQALEHSENLANRRQELLNDMLVQMSFQDLTCQTLQKVSNRLSSLQSELELILSGEKHAIEMLDKKHRGSMSGLDRLKDAQDTDSKQDMIDQLLNGR